MNEDHTPGPWSARIDHDWHTGSVVIEAHGSTFIVADVPRSIRYAHDAALIAAAPDLLDALKALVTDVENGWGDPHTLREARCALKKAARQ